MTTYVDAYYFARHGQEAAEAWLADLEVRRLEHMRLAHENAVSCRCRDCGEYDESAERGRRRRESFRLQAEFFSRWIS